VEAPLAVGTCLNDCASCLIKLYLQRSQRTNGGRLYGCNLYLVTAVPFYSWSFISSKLIHWGLISIIQRYCTVHHITVQCGFFAHPDPATAPRTRKEAKKKWRRAACACSAPSKCSAPSATLVSTQIVLAEPAKSTIRFLQKVGVRRCLEAKKASFRAQDDRLIESCSALGNSRMKLCKCAA
jgi:hypothetical protein